MDGRVLADVVVLAPSHFRTAEATTNGQTREEALSRFGDAMG